MGKITSLFSSKAAPVTVPYPGLKEIIWSEPGQYQRDDDYTDFVFRVLGIGRLHHFQSATYRYLTNPDEKYALGTGNDLDAPLKLHGSAGLLVTAYRTLSGGKGLAVLLRDRIPDVSSCAPGKHIVLGLKGVNRDDDRFEVTGLVSSRLDKNGRVTALDAVPLTQENAETLLTFLAVCMRQMQGEHRLDLPEALESLKTMGAAARGNAPRP